MLHTRLFTHFLFLLFLLLSPAMQAANIFLNDITGNDPSTANPFTSGQVVDPSLTVSGIGRGPGVASNAGDDRYNCNGWNTTTIDLTAYITFTLTPVAGKNIRLSSFTYTGQTSGTGPTSFAFRSSVDNFANNLGSPDNNGATIDLSAAQFQNIKTAITFRLYAWGTTNSGGTFSVNSFVFAGAVVLPVELTRFSAKASVPQEVLLSFSTATERNNHYFSIERSDDGVRFEAIGQVNGAGNSTTQHDYTFTDEHPLKGGNFYRLKQVDFNGQFSYSPVVTVTFGQTGGIRLAPQPVSDQLQVTLEHANEQESQWQVYDFAGRLVQTGTLEAEAGEFRVPTSTLTQGTYVLRILSGQSVMTQQFQKR